MRKLTLCLLFSLSIAAVLSAQQGSVDLKVDELLSKMTLEEKIGQMTLYTSGWTVTGPTLRDSYMEDVRNGRCGNIFNAHSAAYNYKLQQVAVEETRLGIPLLFGYDVIHGYKTIFPIPLAEACSWDLDLIETSARLAAKEATAGGLHWTFNPMVDIARDPRWGRIAEGSGEDPYLGSLIAAAKVRGIQGSDLSDTSTLVACVKHFAAYGGAQAGRDYHTVDVSDRVLREVYLPPYKAAIDAGCLTVMTAFNEVHGVPATGSEYLMEDILREEWGFDGMIVTDYTAINEMIPHGFARDEQHAGELAIKTSVDMDMQGGIYQGHLANLVNEGIIDVELVNAAVRRILRLKFELGLFDDPYRYSDTLREKRVLYSDELMQHALDAARKSIILLKNEIVNDAKILPLLRPVNDLAVIGPLADNRKNLLGSWHAAGDESKVVTLLEGMQKVAPELNIHYAEGCSTEGDDKSGFEKALDIASRADVVIMALGENYRQSGEAASRTELGFPGVQQELLEKIHALGKPVILVVMAGRPLTIEWADENVEGIIYAWHLGTKAGEAIADVIFGKYNPSGKLVISFPRNVGQIPVFYSMKNTGRPFDANNKYTSKYIDAPNEPLYPFGYGQNYSQFRYIGLKLNKSKLKPGQELKVKVELTNLGPFDGEETVQLYIRDQVGSVTRPVKELKDFQKIFLKPGQSKDVEFAISSADLRFYTRSMEFKAEPGMFTVFVGGNSKEVLEAEFELVE